MQERAVTIQLVDFHVHAPLRSFFFVPFTGEIL